MLVKSKVKQMRFELMITIGRTDKMHTNYVLQMKLHFGILFSG